MMQLAVQYSGGAIAGFAAVVSVWLIAIGWLTWRFRWLTVTWLWMGVMPVWWLVAVTGSPAWVMLDLMTNLAVTSWLVALAHVLLGPGVRDPWWIPDRPAWKASSGELAEPHDENGALRPSPRYRQPTTWRQRCLGLLALVALTAALIPYVPDFLRLY